MESHKESLKLQIANLEQEVKAWDSRALEISAGVQSFSGLKPMRTRTQALYDRLLATMQTLDVNKQISPESVTIMEKASPAIPEREGLPRKLIWGAV